MRLVLTEKSSADLRAIYAFSANRWGLEQADRYRERPFSGLDTLVGNPELGRPRRGIGPGVRSLSIEQHVAYYAVSGDEVVVVRVLHQRQRALRTDVTYGEDR